MKRISNKFVILTYGSLFIVSVTLLFTASLFSANTLPAWGGPADVAIAFVIVLSAFWFYNKTGRAQLDHQTRISYAVASILPAILLVILWLLHRKLDFNIVLTGLAWRLYILFQILPRAIYLWNEKPV